MFVVEIVVFLVRIVIHTCTGFPTVTLIPKDHCDMKHGPKTHIHDMLIVIHFWNHNLDKSREKPSFTATFNWERAMKYEWKYNVHTNFCLWRFLLLFGIRTFKKITFI